MGGSSAYAGGKTSFYPRGNLSSLSFQPVANQNAPSRDYDQHHETGGPNGWMVKTMEAQQESAGPGQTGGSGSGNGGSGGGSGSGGSSPATMRAHQRIMQQRHFMQFSKPTALANGSSGGNGSSSGSGSSGSGSQQQSKTQFSFDKNDLASIQSKDTDHLVTVDSKGKKITLQVPTGENVYVGGDGQKGKYAQLVTTKGPVINAQGRYA
jgi:hypothetical protein